MKTTWFVLESEPGRVLVVEINPHRSDGVLKQFTVDGEGYLWMPYTNACADVADPAKPQRFGLLLAVTQGPPPPQVVLDVAGGKEIVIVPMS